MAPRCDASAREGELRPPSKRTLREAAEAWLEGACCGRIHNRSGDPYKPSAIRGYEKALRLRVLPRLGDVRLSELRRIDVQDFVDELVAEGLSASTIDADINPIRAISACHYARRNRDKPDTQCRAASGSEQAEAHRRSRRS
jgi:hypothetical protein